MTNRFQKWAIVFAVLFSMGAGSALAADSAKKQAAPAASAAKNQNNNNEVIERGWTKRCVEPKGGQKACEMFQRLDMKDSSARVAEFAIGFPQEKDVKKGTGRGVVILPLGILLEQGVTMKIGDNKPVLFKVRYCTNAGCFSYVNLDGDILDSMKKEKTVTFNFKTAEMQDVNLIMSLTGFEKVLKEIQ